MSNPGVIQLAETIINGKSFRIEDNIGESIHIHFDSMRIDMTIPEYLDFTKQITNITAEMILAEGEELDLSKVNNDVETDEKEINKATPVDRLDSYVPVRYKSFDVKPEGVDEKWYFRMLAGKKYYEIVIRTVKMKDLRITVYNGYSFETKRIEFSPAYKFLCGDRNYYKAYQDMIRCLMDHNVEASSEKYLETIESLEKGYDYKKKIIVFNGENKILDGQHRVAWLYKTFGPEHEIDIFDVRF